MALGVLNVQIVALDINGTLIDGTYYSWTKIIEEDLGFKKRENASPLKWYEVQTGKISFEEAISLTYNVEDLKTLKIQAFKKYMANLKIREGCIDLLEALRQKYKLVICSDTSGVTKVIAKTFNLEKYFTESFYSIDVGWMKSDREFWTSILSSLSINPDELVMVGDNPHCDIHWPNVLGMNTIQVKTTEILPNHDLEIVDDNYTPDYYMEDLKEVYDILIEAL
jgi:HAD superfamily hydrolase (TIGR01549 family)